MALGLIRDYKGIDDTVAHAKTEGSTIDEWWWGFAREPFSRFGARAQRLWLSSLA
jgi:hypothetical protein